MVFTSDSTITFMKHIILPFLLFIFLISCQSRKSATEEADVTLEEEDTLYRFRYFNDNLMTVTLLKTDIVIDSIKLEVAFETGGTGLILDGSAAARIFNLDSVPRTKERLEYSYAARNTHFYKYNCPVDVPFGGDTLHYEYFFVHDLKEFYGVDGFMSIPRRDEHIWNLDFEKCKIEISEKDIPDSYDIKVKVKRGMIDKFILEDFPLTFAGKGDTLSTFIDLILDTGSDNSLSFLAPESLHKTEIDFFKKNSMISYSAGEYGNDYFIEEIGSAKDTLYINSNPARRDKMSIIGLNLMTKYNIVLDLSRDTAYFSRNKNGNFLKYLRAHGQSENIVLLPINNNQNAIVLELPEYNKGHLGDLRIYDIILSFDGKPWSTIKDDFFSDTVSNVLEIDRFGERRSTFLDATKRNKKAFSPE